MFPGRFYMVTRRCLLRQFLMRPDADTNNNYLYCLAEAAERFDITVVLTQAMSNHHHPLVYDRHGRINEFTERMHQLFARSQNALRGRWEYFWTSGGPSVVELVEEKDVLDKLLYVAMNPVEAGLVEKVHHWPGVPAYSALMTGRTLTARRPHHFFRDEGPMPETVTIKFGLPAEFGDATSLLKELARRVGVAEQELAEQRRREGRGILGRSRVLRQSWRDSPTSREPRRGLNPRVAAKNKWARIAALQKNRAFIRAYRLARAMLLAGQEAVFPAGTYWLKRFMNVTVAPYVPDTPLFT